MKPSHGMASHGCANALKRLTDRRFDPLIENQRVGCEGSPLFGKIGLDLVGAAGAARPAAGGTTWAGGRGFPRSGGHPPLQGQAFSHRSRFLPLPQAGKGRVARVRTNGTLVGTGLGSGGKAACAISGGRP